MVAHLYPEYILTEESLSFHPEDIRYSHLKNVQLWNPIGRQIDVRFDENVDISLNNGIRSNRNEITKIIDQNGSILPLEIVSEELYGVDLDTARNMIRPGFEK
jgi:valyl-tRNA synthetase